MKSVLLFEGPGFSDQADLIHNLELRGFRVILRRVGFEKGALPLPEVKSADLVILRGPWTLSPEERLLARVLADRLKESLAPLVTAARSEKSSGGPAFLGIGRGTLLLWLLGWLDEKSFAGLRWQDAFKGDGPWVKAKYTGSGLEFKALVNGRALPEIGAALKMNDWIRSDDRTVGWRTGSRLFGSLVDIFAYAERTQLADFGYTDLLNVPTQAMVLDTFLDRELEKA